GVSIRREGGMVELSVKDQGIGISKENLERVFERFFRVDKARSRDTGGSGLGLAIVKHIATDHGGQVTAWSMAGQGSTFTLHIPERGRTEPSTAGGSDRIRTAAAEQAPGKGSRRMARILIGEDGESFADPLPHSLRKEGYDDTGAG